MSTSYEVKHTLKCPCGEVFECNATMPRVPISRKELDKMSVALYAQPICCGWDLEGGATCPSCSDRTPVSSLAETYYHLHKAGFGPAAIANFYGISRGAVSNQIKTWAERLEDEEQFTGVLAP